MSDSKDDFGGPVKSGKKVAGHSMSDLVSIIPK